jgi:D-alanyl-D-alanine carboxypeptidase
MIFKKAYLFLLFLPSLVEAQEATSWLNKLSDSVRIENSVPGLACALITLDSIQYGISGTRSVDSDSLIELKDPFHIGSNSKAITSYIAFRLIEEGKISLDSKLFDLVDDVKRRKWRYRKITLGDLLSHTSRIRAYTANDEFELVPDWIKTLSVPGQRLAFTAHVVRQKPLKKGRNYSNAGYVLASLMLERASGIPFEDLVSKYFGELSIDYFYGFPARLSSSYPKGHWMENGTLVAHDSSHPYQLPSYLRSAGGFSLNIVDYSHFVQEQLRGLNGQGKSLKPESFQRMHFEKSGYSYGWGNANIGGLTASFHDGSAGTFYTHCVLVPEKQIAIVIFMNTGSPNEAHSSIRKAILKTAVSSKK